MKNLIALAFTLALFTTAMFAQNSNHVYVNGYTKSNGTYVQGHYRTAANTTINDNFSTHPNVNPYTGVQGTITPTYNNTIGDYRSKSNNGSTNYDNTYSAPTNTRSRSYNTYSGW